MHDAPMTRHAGGYRRLVFRRSAWSLRRQRSCLREPEMRLLSFQKDHDVGFGAVIGDGVVDLSRRMGLRSVRALLESGTLADAAAIVARESDDFPLAGIRFLPPIP